MAGSEAMNQFSSPTTPISEGLRNKGYFDTTEGLAVVPDGGESDETRENVRTNSRPKALPVISENIPTELKRMHQWVVWRYENDQSRKQWTKVPYCTDGKRRASSTDSATWASFDSALALYNQGTVDGIGFVVTTETGIVGIDLDHCYNRNTKKFEPWAIEIIQAMQSYSEFSPSGEGVRIFARGVLPPGGRKKGNIEMYETGRYFTVTGHRLKGVES